MFSNTQTFILSLYYWSSSIFSVCEYVHINVQPIGEVGPLFKNFFNVLFLLLRDRETERERERQHEWGRGRERRRHRIQSRLQALSCQHRARSRARIHEPRDHDLSRSQMLNRLSHPGTPGPLLIYLA